MSGTYFSRKRDGYHAPKSKQYKCTLFIFMLVRSTYEQVREPKVVEAIDEVLAMAKAARYWKLKREDYYNTRENGNHPPYIIRTEEQ